MVKNKQSSKEENDKPWRKYRKRAMGKMDKIPFSEPKGTNVPDLGFHFNPDENYRIMLACMHAGEYMKEYGKGRLPYSIDLSHFHNNIPDDDNPHYI